jgi:hypothetical protein
MVNLAVAVGKCLSVVLRKNETLFTSKMEPLTLGHCSMAIVGQIQLFDGPPPFSTAPTAGGSSNGRIGPTTAPEWVPMVFLGLFN